MRWFPLALTRRPPQTHGVEVSNGTLIVSTGRCGSTLMSDLMNLHADVLSLSEFFTMVGPGMLRAPDMDGIELWGKMRFVSQQSKDLMRLAPCDEILADVSGGEPYPEPLELITIPHLARAPAGTSAEVIHSAFRFSVEQRPIAPVREHFANVFNSVAALLVRKCWVERSGATMDYINLLLPCFPDARIIHVYRDGRETALSMSRHPYFKMRAVYSCVRPMPIAEALKFDLPIVEFGRYWSDMMIKGLKALADDGRPVLHVSYESLTGNPEAELRRVFEFMGVGVDARYLDAATSSMRAPRLRVHHLAPSVKRTLRNACKPGMDALERVPP